MILNYLPALLLHCIILHLLQHHLLCLLGPNLCLHKLLQMQLHHLRLLELPERLLNAILHHRSNKRLKRHNLALANPGISLPQSLHCTLRKSVLCNREQSMHSLQSTKSPKATEQLPDLHFVEVCDLPPHMCLSFAFTVLLISAYFTCAHCTCPVSRYDILCLSLSSKLIPIIFFSYFDSLISLSILQIFTHRFH